MVDFEKFSIHGYNSEDIWGFENAWFWFSHPSRLNKTFAHYELYKSITGIPGDIFELGVYKAASLIRFATFRNLLENDFSRKIVGFDSFGKFPRESISLKTDHEFIDIFETQGGNGLSKNEVSKILEHKSFSNYELIEGNVLETITTYLKNFPATRIALLHLDMDVKEPTEHALNVLYDRVVPGGLIVFDDYSTVAGETDAVDSFLAHKKLAIEKLSHYKIPSFVRKPI